MEKEIIQFLTEAEKLKSTLRHNWTTTGRQESVAEHSWRLALFLIILQDLHKYKIDVLKTLKMSLVHDLPEIIDGDIPGFEKKKSDTEKEIKNAEKIFNILPAPLNKEYYGLVQEYEKGKSGEAKLVKALDKIEAQLQHLESGPDYWTVEEKGEHMLTYPNKCLEALGEESVNKIWELIKKELKKLT